MHSLTRRGFFPAIALALFAPFLGLLPIAQPARAQDLNPALPLIHVENGPNSAAAQKAHYVVLVSLDGFRWDYAKRDGATHLLALGQAGSGRPKACCRAIPRSRFPIISPS